MRRVIITDEGIQTDGTGTITGDHWTDSRRLLQWALLKIAIELNNPHRPPATVVDPIASPRDMRYAHELAGEDDRVFDQDENLGNLTRPRRLR